MTFRTARFDNNAANPAVRGSVARSAARYAVVAVAIFWCSAVSAQGERNLAPVPVDHAPFVHTKTLTTGAVVSDNLAINPFAFEGLEASDIQVLKASNVGRFCDPSIMFACLLEAPVELPTGTVVTRIELDAVDSSPSFVKANFYRCPIGAAACDLLAEVSTEGTPGPTQVGVDLVNPEPIDNENSTYLVEVFPGNDAVTRLVGLRLVLAGPESVVRSEVLALHAYAFEGRTSDDRDALRAVSVQRYCTGTTCTLAAPVELPSGATVTRIDLDAYDFGSASVGATFSRCGVATALCTEVASVSTTGTPGFDQPGMNLTVPEVIDNSAFTYLVEVSLGSDNNTRLIGMRFDVQLPSAFSRDDRLSIGPFAFEGHEAADNGVMNATNGERFCDGQNCTMTAPVELPSGTRLDRIELSGWDTDSADLRAALMRCPLGVEICEEVAAVSTSGTPGATVVPVDLGTVEVIDNRLFTYMIEVEGGPNAATSLRAVSLSIERALIFSDGFGSGDTIQWSNAVP